jgi:hypothetical protein
MVSLEPWLVPANTSPGVTASGSRAGRLTISFTLGYMRSKGRRAHEVTIGHSANGACSIESQMFFTLKEGTSLSPISRMKIRLFIATFERVQLFSYLESIRRLNL